MITRSFLLILACSSYLLIIQKTIAVRVTPNIDDFLIENHRTKTRTRQNYMVQRAFDDELSANLDNWAPMPEGIDTKTSPDELSSQIANIIRNDIIYLDNSVETTTRKRGNIMKKNLAIPVSPCSCMSKKHEIFLGDNYFPTRLDTWTCLKGTCDTRCKPIYYWVIVLKKPKFENEDFHPKWVAHRIDAHGVDALKGFDPRWELHLFNVTASCVCISSDDNKSTTN